MKMDFDKFKMVVDSKKLSSEFCSQDFLSVYRELFEEDYIEKAAEKSSFRKLHGPIGSYLKRKEKELGIYKISSKSNMNIKGNSTKCAMWKKK